MTFDPARAFPPERAATLDLETFLVEDGLLTPPIVCAATARLAAGGVAARLVAPGVSRVEKAAGGARLARELLAEDGLVIVGANLPYDFGCLLAEDPSLLELVFQAYAEGRVFDVLIGQGLHAIAEGNHGQDPRTGRDLDGGYSLELVVALVLGRVDAKEHAWWRRRYALLAELPVEEWPEDARLYPVDDARNPLDVMVAMVRGGGGGVTPGPHRNLEDMAAQAESAFALHLGAAWGVRADGERVHELRARVEVDHAEFVRRHARFFKCAACGRPATAGCACQGRADLKEDRRERKRAVVLAYGGGAPCVAPGCVDGKALSMKTGNRINCAACSGTGLYPAGAPRTPTGGIKADRDALVESGDPELVPYGDNEPEKIRGTYLPWLERGIIRPLVLRPNVLVASGRTSYYDIVQTMSREGGVRECLRARGAWCGAPVEYCFCSVDYAAIELCTLAQACLWTVGWSRMADVLVETGSPGALHTALAARLRGWSFDDMKKAVKAEDPVALNFRWTSKSLNFGLAGGMGSVKFVLAQRRKAAGKTTSPDGQVTYPGLRFCVLLEGAARCGAQVVTEWRGRPTPAPVCRRCVEIVDRDLRPAWFREWPEVESYHAWVSSMVDAGGEAPCFVPDGDGGWTARRVRGGLEFTSMANGSFQSLAADGAKAALRALTREAYLDSSSPLYGSRVIFFVHDECVAEVPLDRADAAARRMVEVMVREMKRYVPDVPVVAEPALMYYWSKVAKDRYVDDPAAPGGRRLVPWDEPGEARRAA